MAKRSRELRPCLPNRLLPALLLLCLSVGATSSKAALSAPRRLRLVPPLPPPQPAEQQGNCTGPSSYVGRAGFILIPTTESVSTSALRCLSSDGAAGANATDDEKPGVTRGGALLRAGAGPRAGGGFPKYRRHCTEQPLFP